MAPTRCLNPELFRQAANLPKRYQSSCMHAPVQTYLVTPLNGSSTLRSAGNFQSTTGPQKVNPLHASTLIAYAEAHLAITIAYAEAHLAITIRKPYGHTCCQQLKNTHPIHRQRPSGLLSLCMESRICSNANHKPRRLAEHPADSACQQWLTCAHTLSDLAQQLKGLLNTVLLICSAFFTCLFHCPTVIAQDVEAGLSQDGN